MNQSSNDSTDLIERYVAMWNEPDPELRHKAIRELWAPGGNQVLHSPPQEVRDAATSLGFAIPCLEVSGYEALDGRVSRAYEQFVMPGAFVFRHRGEPSRPLSNILTFRWEMLPTSGGAAAGAGLEVLVLDDDGRIASDHQFIEP
jgi:hypothetical protein